MTLSEDLKSKKLAILVEMFGYTEVFRMDDVRGRELRDVRILSWMVRNKMIEMGLEVKYSGELYKRWTEHGRPLDYQTWLEWHITPEDIIEAGIDVYKQNKLDIGKK